MSERTPAFWDEAAGTFDAEADHGPGDGAVRTAWRDLVARSRTSGTCC